MSFQPGDGFGRYEIAELLGRGGMGEVYRARDTLLHRRVALKILHPPAQGTGSRGSKTDAATRILREARAAAGLEHPNAVSIYDVGEVSGLPFLAMEFIAGRTLRHFIGHPSISMGRRIRWLVDVARALEAAHQLGLVHRDVKPENVMVREDGVVKVVDFGIARRTAGKTDPTAVTEEAAALATLTEEGGVVGTPFYMAPEQMRGETLDGRADQFAWGVLAYELLTGSRPWEKNADPLQLVAQILSRDVDPPRERNAEIPVGVDAAIRRALAKVRTGRFPQMKDAADALEACAGPGGVATGRSEARISTPAEEISLAPTQAATRENPVVGADPSTRTQLATAPAPVPSARTRWPAAAAMMVAVAVAGGVASRLAMPPRGPSAASPDAAPAAVESQMSSNPQATAAYRAGMRTFRDGSLELAKEQLDRALELDPTFAAAHLRRALLPTEDKASSLRGDLQRARGARETLGEHDRVLLEAMEPRTRTPSDLRESARRLAGALGRAASDADFAFQLGWVSYDAYDSEKADAAFDAAIRADPTFAMAWRMKARTHVLMDDATGANEAYARCLEVSPSATSCLDDLATLQGKQGDCAGMATSLRKLISVSPETEEPHRLLAGALFGSGEPIDAVRASLMQGWERSPEKVRSLVRRIDEAALAALTGQFDEAVRLDGEIEQALAASTNEMWHYGLAYDRMLLRFEVGRNADALGYAKEYLSRRSAWQLEDIETDPSITLYALEKRAGGLTFDQFATLRETWLAADRKHIERVGLSPSAYEGAAWAYAYALPAGNADEAAAAIAVRPKGRPLLDGWTEDPCFDEPIGRAYLLAGNLDDALSVLTRASKSCAVFGAFAPEFTTWATAELGEALEAKGAPAEACAAYRRVLERWGKAKPPSRTAQKARERARMLKCGP